MIDGLVSIIMPSWNTGRFIAESIQSVIDQTYKNWELIIVDDCSTDNSRKIINEIDRRIDKLAKHENDIIPKDASQYEQLDNVVANIICSALLGELEGLKSYIEDVRE